MEQNHEHYTHTYKRAMDAVRECCEHAKRRIQVEANAFMAAANVLGIPRTFPTIRQCYLYMGESEEAALGAKDVFQMVIPTAQDGAVEVICTRYTRRCGQHHRTCYLISVRTPQQLTESDPTEYE